MYVRAGPTLSDVRVCAAGMGAAACIKKRKPLPLSQSLIQVFTTAVDLRTEESDDISDRFFFGRLAENDDGLGDERVQRGR